jgi:hypothetical protein
MNGGETRGKRGECVIFDGQEIRARDLRPH